VSTQPQPLKLFYSYAREDEELRDELEKHLAVLKRDGAISEWHDRALIPGQEWDEEIKAQLDRADIILLLISPDFLASDYIHRVELTRALERHEAREARVIPIILRPSDWANTPFSKLQALPKDAEPVTRWANRDEAFLNISKGIRAAAEKLSSDRTAESLTPAAAPKTRTNARIPRPPIVGFVSRRNEQERDIVALLKEELSPQKIQLVALWGAGGVGKTTLAAEAVRELEESGQRVVWTTAEGRNFTFTTLLDDIAEQLGRTDLRPLAPQPKEEAVHALIAEAPVLIILDNFETISPPEQLLCRDFLGQRVRCPALITTREYVVNARSVPLDHMRPDEANEFLDRLIEQSRDSDIYTEETRQRILETAEFYPLVIQWVVAQINLAQAPDEVLDELAHGEGDAAQRVFDRSFNLPQLAEGGRAVLLALSLFMPSATRPALAEVAAMNKEKDKKKFKKAQQTLASLWLIRQTDGGQRLAVEGLTRELAKARLSRDPRSKVFRRRFIGRFLHYAEAHSEATAEHLNSVGIEKDNILNAIALALEAGELKNAMRVYAAVINFLDIRGYWDEAKRSGERALGVARNSAALDAISFFGGNVASFYLNRGHVVEARRLYEESLEIGRQLGDQHTAAATLHELGKLAQISGEYDEARRLYSESLEIEERFGTQLGVAQTFHQLAILSQKTGQLDEAQRLYGESLEITRRLGDQRSVASTLHELGSLAVAAGEFEEARRLYHESLEITLKLGDQHAVATALNSLGTMAEDEGDNEEAARLYREALSIFERLGSPDAEVSRKNLEDVEGSSS
jgi:tetratricopeptide (TPR) repeat protein